MGNPKSSVVAGYDSVRADLRVIMSVDVDDVSSYRPDKEVWAIGLRFIAGPADGPGEESFDLTVCSVAWIAARIRENDIFDPRHCLIANGFNWPLLSSYIESRVRTCEGPSWDEVAAQLGRLGRWEFEDCLDPRHVYSVGSPRLDPIREAARDSPVRTRRSF